MLKIVRFIMFTIKLWLWIGLVISVLILILLDEKLYKEKDKSILIYDISYKTRVTTRPLRISFNKKPEWV